VRICSVCRCEDQTIIREGQVDFAGRPIVEHLVTIELRYMRRREELTKYHETKGWSYYQHLGRHAMKRMICRDCLNQSSILRRDFERKKQSEMRQSNVESYYLNLCEGS